MGRQKLNITTPEEARAYLSKVVNGWLTFCSAHEPVRKAISILLKESEVKRNESKRH